MTLTEIVELVAERTGVEPRVAWGFIQSFIEVAVEEIDKGHDVKIRGLGSFRWIDVSPQKLPFRSTIPSGRKLKFKPATKFRHRRT